MRYEWGEDWLMIFREGKRHREDGPAVTYSNGTRLWYRDGKLHREDGPAVIYSNGKRYWYRNGERFYKNLKETKV